MLDVSLPGFVFAAFVTAAACTAHALAMRRMNEAIGGALVTVWLLLSSAVGAATKNVVALLMIVLGALLYTVVSRLERRGALW